MPRDFRRMLAMALQLERAYLGFGIGAIIGSTLTPQTVYVAPPPPVYCAPPPPPAYYGAVVYGPPYRYGYYRYRHR